MNDPTNNQPTVTYEIEGYLKTAIKIGVSKPRIVKVTREIINEEDV